MMILTLVYDNFAAVVVTGGNDSLALTLLAKQAFQKVIGITVDHRLANSNSIKGHSKLYFRFLSPAACFLAISASSMVCILHAQSDT